MVLGLSGPALAADNGSGGSQEGGIGKELNDLGQEIRKSMQEQGRYIGRKLSEWGKQSRSWADDRALQARVKTTLSGVLGASSVTTINVDVSDGVVTLHGKLGSWERVARAVRAVEQIEGVRRVVSRLNVAGGA